MGSYVDDVGCFLKGRYGDMAERGAEEGRAHEETPQMRCLQRLLVQYWQYAVEVVAAVAAVALAGTVAVVLVIIFVVTVARCWC